AVAATLAGRAVPAPRLHWRSAGGPARRLRAEVGADPGGLQALLVVTPAEDEAPAGPREP
ncbi:MAG: hypothetical protein KGJ24_16045, partial [Burkholderiales bacterium]|nr:hypothetical protein [Burkholderiales bacterium]